MDSKAVCPLTFPPNFRMIIYLIRCCRSLWNLESAIYYSTGQIDSITNESLGEESIKTCLIRYDKRFRIISVR